MHQPPSFLQAGLGGHSRHRFLGMEALFHWCSWQLPRVWHIKEPGGSGLEPPYKKQNTTTQLNKHKTQPTQAKVCPRWLG